MAISTSPYVNGLSFTQELPQQRAGTETVNGHMNAVKFFPHLEIFSQNRAKDTWGHKVSKYLNDNFDKINGPACLYYHYFPTDSPDHDWYCDIVTRPSYEIQYIF